jgi:hypothetical protein
MTAGPDVDGNAGIIVNGLSTVWYLERLDWIFVDKVAERIKGFVVWHQIDFIQFVL